MIELNQEYLYYRIKKSALEGHATHQKDLNMSSFYVYDDNRTFDSLTDVLVAALSAIDAPDSEDLGRSEDYGKPKSDDPFQAFSAVSALELQNHQDANIIKSKELPMTDEVLAAIFNITALPMTGPGTVKDGEEFISYELALSALSASLLMQDEFKEPIDDSILDDLLLLSGLTLSPFVPGDQSEIDSRDPDILKESLLASISEHAALLSSRFSLFRCIPLCLTTLIICSCTDWYGRRLGIIIAILGSLLRCSVFLIVEVCQLDLKWIVVGEVFDGLSGHDAAFIGSALAYTSDLVCGANLVFRYLVLNSIAFLAGAVASFSIGAAITHLGFSCALCLIIGSYALALLYSTLILSESLPQEIRHRVSVKNTLVQCLRSFRVFTRERKNKSDKIFMILLAVGGSIMGFCITSLLDLNTAYLQGPPFYMDPDGIGNVIGIVCITVVLVPPLLGKFLKLFLSEALMIVVISASYSLVFIWMGLCKNTLQIFIGGQFC